MRQDDWTGCYRDGWKGIITEASFAHPAKFSRGLIRRIYEHAADEGWLIADDVIIDPFGGIALGGFDAAMFGAHWIGCELEAKFVELAEENIAEWRHRYGHRQGYGNARIVQGDSRKLSEILRATGLCVSSPPFSPDQPCASQTRAKKDYQAFTRGDGTKRDHEMRSEGNLDGLPMTEAGLTLAISSPPYAGNEKSDYNLSEDGKTRRRDVGRGYKQGHGCFRGSETYGQSDGQLGAMKEPSEGFKRNGCQAAAFHHMKYGDSDAQVGAKGGEDFWSAARLIVEQTYSVLAPGAHAIWVVKGFVRKKTYVDFPDQWRQLCEAVGFETLHWHNAMLVEQGTQQHRLDGGVDDNSVERKSFFRRLAESKGSPRIDFEVVLCMVKPVI